MREEILNHLQDPGKLEKLYRSNKHIFRRAFNTVYPTVQGNILADSWNERLNYEADEIKWNSRDLLLVGIMAIVAGVIAKIPSLFKIDEEFFYTRNIGFIIFPVLFSYFSWKNKLSLEKILFIAGTTLAALIFINYLPNNTKSDSLILSCIHLVLFLWSILGIAFVGEKRSEIERHLAFLSYNGDVVVMTALIMIAAGILTGASVGLFSLIGLDIKDFFFNNIVLFGLPAAPILATYLTQTYPQLVSRVSPVIARIFSPLVLLMLLVYIAAIIYSGKDPYNDRDFLMIFNLLLIGVLAIIFFSMADVYKNSKSKSEILILLALSLVTIAVNGIALSAILFRISEWGITPNRAAVLGGNLLILVNLLLVATYLFKVIRNKANITIIGKIIAYYLPVYFIWAATVTFLFPFLFNFK